MKRHQQTALLLATLLTVGSVSMSLGEVRPTVAGVAAPFDLSSVRLLEGPFKDAQNLDQKYLLSLDVDRLLHVFRLNAGLPSTAQPYGGWEAPTIELRGHFVGHYLSACALMYRSTGDARFKERVDHLVAALAECQTALGGTYLSAFPESFFDRVEAGKGVWAPYYTIHKVMAGLLDAHRLCDNPQALRVVQGMSAYFKQRMDKLSDAQMARVMTNEYGGMMEVLANLYAVTGNPDDLALAKRFDDRAVFDPLAQRQDRLAGLHANTQIPKITGAARFYELTGTKRYQTVADYFWSQVTDKRSFVNGGNSFAEHFRPLGVEAGELIPTTAETCNTYNMLKLTRRLFQWQPDARYADYYERALYNHILASIDPDSGMMLYFFSLRPGHFKVYNTPADSFWCCTGTGVENHAQYGDSIYFHGNDTLWVNLFIASELTWSEKGVTVRQETRFPEEQGTTLTVRTSRPTRLAVKVRRPYWATGGMAVKVNGQSIDVSDTAPSSYATIDREWSDGDRIEVGLPMSLHAHRAADLKDHVAILYGPLVLAGQLGRENYPDTDLVRNQTDLANAKTPAVPAIVSGSDDPRDWLQPVSGRPLEFTTANATKPTAVTLAPAYRVNHQRYTVYWKRFDPQQWTAHEAQLKAEDERARIDAARVVDEANFGQPQPERDHGFRGERTSAGQFRDRFYRDAQPGGWFSAELKVLPDVPQTLRCTYWGSDRGRRFDVLIDGTKIATQSLNAAHPEAFYTVEHPIPPELVKGKSSVTVRFQAGEEMAGGVFGCEVLKPAEPAATQP